MPVKRPPIGAMSISIYQSLIGAWPADGAAPDKDFVARMQQSMSKATREKKTHTSWINPSRAYDEAVVKFVDRTLSGPHATTFLRSFLPFLKKVSRFGLVNSLSQLTLKIASPGVPDFYQGSELWDLSLVDPDNRRPVDFKLRCRYLDSMAPLLDPSAPENVMVSAVSEMLGNWEDGRIKQYLTAAGLRLRREHQALFLEGDYFAMNAIGDRQDRLAVIARANRESVLIAIAPRLTAGLAEVDRWLPLGEDFWKNTEIEIPVEWSTLLFRDRLTGRPIRPGAGPDARIRIADVLQFCPVALLVGYKEARS